MQNENIFKKLNNKAKSFCVKTLGCSCPCSPKHGNSSDSIRRLGSNK